MVTFGVKFVNVRVVSAWIPLRCGLLGLGPLLSMALSGADEAPELPLMRAWPIEHPARLDPSGIGLRDGLVYVVSDKIDDTIFRLEFNGEVATAVPAVTFAPPVPIPEVGRLDLEALAVAPNGDFLVASEWGFAAAQVPRDGGQARWVTPNIKAWGASAGLFATPDRYLEGMALLSPNHYLFVAELMPRGLVEVKIHEDGEVMARPQRFEESRYARPRGAGLDWTDLCVWQDRVFALARNQSLVVELLRSPDGNWIEGQAWSFWQTESAPEHRYEDMRFGRAEGLAITDDRVYVLLDNNGNLRAGTEDDRRPWLFVFESPLRD